MVKFGGLLVAQLLTLRLVLEDGGISQHIVLFGHVALVLPLHLIKLVLFLIGEIRRQIKVFLFVRCVLRKD